MSMIFIVIAAPLAIGGGYFLYQLALDRYNGQHAEDYERRYRAVHPDAAPGQYLLKDEDNERVVYVEQRFDGDYVSRRTMAFGRNGEKLTPPPSPLAYAMGALVAFIGFILVAMSTTSSTRPPSQPFGNSSPISR